ncbi:MAG: hypothetical protein HPY74_05705 [Firmicutes bacterium]|nr:hypothetical protein [Bacillota bacterium]
MNYRELLELTKKHPNPFSINQRKIRMYDFETENIPQKSAENLNKEEYKNSQNTQKASYCNYVYREALKTSKSNINRNRNSK